MNITQVGSDTLLFTASPVDSGISIFKVSANGSLTNIANINDNSYENFPYSVTTAQIGDNTYIYTANSNYLASSSINIFKLKVTDNTFSPSEVIYDVQNITSVKDNAILKLNGAIAIHTTQVGSNTYLFVAGYKDNGISVFEVSADGNLRNVDNISDNWNLKLNGARSINTTQIGDNTYLFVTGFDDNGVSVFEVSADGKFKEY